MPGLGEYVCEVDMMPVLHIDDRLLFSSLFLLVSWVHFRFMAFGVFPLFLFSLHISFIYTIPNFLPEYFPPPNFLNLFLPPSDLDTTYHHDHTPRSQTPPHRKRIYLKSYTVTDYSNPRVSGAKDGQFLFHPVYISMHHGEAGQE